MHISEGELRSIPWSRGKERDIDGLVTQLLDNQSVKREISRLLSLGNDLAEDGHSGQLNKHRGAVKVINVQLTADDIEALNLGNESPVCIPIIVLPAAYPVQGLDNLQNEDSNETVRSAKLEYSEIAKAGGLEINRQQRKVWYDSQECHLTPKEFELLWMFVQHPKRVFTRRELVSQIWGVNFDGYEHTVSNHMNRLRKKLTEISNGSLSIDTVWGIGYRFDN